MKCYICNNEKAQKHPTFGYIPCKTCQEKSRAYPRVNRLVEFTTDSIKQQRKEFKDDIIAPFRDGVVSQEYLQKYGTKGIKVSKQDIKNAKNTWLEDKFYDN